VNSKVKITGADTHSADLTGTTTLAEGGNTETQNANGTTSGGATTTKRNNGSDGATILTFSSITTPVNSTLIIITATAPQLTTGSNAKTILLKRGSTVLETISIDGIDSNSTVQIANIHIDASPQSGTNTYTLEQDDNSSFGGVTATLMFIELTDTHAASLIGANTQNTNASDSLP